MSSGSEAYKKIPLSDRKKPVATFLTESILAQHGTHAPVLKYAFRRKIYGELRHAFLISTKLN